MDRKQNQSLCNPMSSCERPDQRWYETDSSEIRAFIGIRVYMSVTDLPDIKMHWTEDCLFGGLSIANVMSRSQFEKISQYFTFHQ